MRDKLLQARVTRELEWDPRVDAAHIGVTAKDGAVTLSGHVASYSERVAAIEAAERVYGVRAVADELEVKLPRSHKRDDTDIAEAIAHKFRWSLLIPDTIDAEVTNGFVTLRGDVRWNYQRDAAERAVQNIEGVVGMANLITVKPRVKPSQIKQQVTDALQRAASLDARSISVSVSDGAVHLYGEVHSPYEKRIAENAAKSAPGVKKIDNDIVVTP
ncbi:MAG: BON domain-containing protein [Gaiellaceae bacterium]